MAKPGREGKAPGTAMAVSSAVNAATERELAALRVKRDKISAEMHKRDEAISATPANEERKAEDVYGMFGIPVRVTIPRYRTDVIRDYRLILNDVHHAPFPYYRYNYKYNYKYKTDSN